MGDAALVGTGQSRCLSSGSPKYALDRGEREALTGARHPGRALVLPIRSGGYPKLACARVVLPEGPLQEVAHPPAPDEDAVTDNGLAPQQHGSHRAGHVQALERREVRAVVQVRLADGA